MKLFITMILLATLFACDAPTKEISKDFDAQISLEVLNDYVANCNDLKDPGKWVENHQLLSKDFKKDYKEMITQAYKDDPELGLGFDPIFNAQDYPEKGFKISSVLLEKRMVILEGIDMPTFTVATKLVEINGEWFLDGAGVIRIPKS